MVDISFHAWTRCEPHGKWDIGVEKLAIWIVACLSTLRTLKWGKTSRIFGARYSGHMISRLRDFGHGVNQTDCFSYHMGSEKCIVYICLVCLSSRQGWTLILGLKAGNLMIACLVCSALREGWLLFDRVIDAPVCFFRMYWLEFSKMHRCSDRCLERMSNTHCVCVGRRMWITCW